MTTQEIINYYADLLILQYRGKPKAYAHIQALAKMLVMDQLPTQVRDAFNLSGSNIAAGVQLDVIGKYVGVVRYGNGVSGPITLDDDEFLKLLQMASIKNFSGSSLAEIQDLLFRYFPNQVFVFDYKNMRMSYLVDSDLGSQDLVQLFINSDLLPKPMAVGLSAVIYAADISNFFGFRTYELPAFMATPFNAYATYQTDWPWLSYADAIGSSVTPIVAVSRVTTESGDFITTESGDRLIIE